MKLFADYGVVAPACHSLGSPRTYEDIKALAKVTGKKIPELLALASQNDPFYIMPAQAKQAEWFAALWMKFDLPAGVHLRRIHYRLVSQASPFVMFNGLPYENTEKCWQDLGAASKAARCLGLVAADAFEDKRNPDPVVIRAYQQAAPRIGVDWDQYDATWDIPTIAVDLADDLYWGIPDIDVSGYTQTVYDAQPFHLELISEKSTMDDIVIPLCSDYGINYAPATGFQSITGVVAMLKRLRQANKPGVVFYISDFDPAGSFMPPSVARQLEFWLPKYAADLNVLLLPIVLTLEQVRHYQLPPIPIKDTDKRQDNFLEKFGVKGATELDALEALHPGELAKIIGTATAPYRDAQAESKALAVRWNAERQIGREWSAISRPHRWRMKQIREQAKAIIESYQDRLLSLREAMKEDLAQTEIELKSLRQAVKADLADFDPMLPDPYQPTDPLPDAFDGLFDSRRDYLEQLEFYKARLVSKCLEAQP